MKTQLTLLSKKFGVYFGTSLFTFFTPIQGAIWFVIILVIADTITGIMKAGKSSIDKIQSKKAFRLVPKLIFYFVIIILAHSLNLTIDKTIPWVKLALVGISWIEVKSIDENFNEIFGFSFLDKCLEAGKKITELKRK
jgi:phage-related holin